MKILLVLNSIRVSGSEKLMTALAKELSRHGYQFWICPLITPFDEEFKRSLESDGFNLNILLPPSINNYDGLVWRLNGITRRLFNWSVREWIMRRYISRKCTELGIQLAVTNSYTADLFTVKIGIPYVVIEHGAYSSYIVEGASFDPAPIEKSLSVVAVSQWSKHLLESKFPNKPVLKIYNAFVPTIPYKSQSIDHLKRVPGIFTFCMHGRDTEQKGWDLAIDSFLQFRVKGFKTRLVLLSAGPYIESLKARYKNNSDIIFGGLVYNIEEVIADVDAGLVLSKRYEAFGLSILDYFQKGKPVIAGSVGGIPEVVEVDELKGGIMVGADNGVPRVPEIVEAMERMIQDKNMYATLAANGPLIAKKFNMQACAAEYHELFTSIVK